MKLGVFSILFNDWTLDDTLDYIKGMGLEAVEIGTGGYSKSNHLEPREIINSKIALENFKDKFKKRDIIISALGAHGNPVHPNKDIAKKHHEEFEETVLAAEKLGVDTVLVLSGCPGGSPRDETPNWSVVSWPDDFREVQEYQWNEVLIPYWKKAAAFARDHGVTKIAVEPHPGFCVYNTETMLKLRQEVGENIGVNFDPSHLFWQMMDPCAAIAKLKDCIFHFHAKDSVLAQGNVAVNGVLDARSYADMEGRSWNFRTVGYGHSSEVWNNIMSALAMAGYDYVISIEHEDSLMDREEGFEKAVDFLKQVIIRKRPEKMWWEMRVEG
ncbi:MAG: sugar phosphate isomerase/epimerase family protein [Mahellales bacterium]|jgi:sugar phosphate isomerase/epimerase